MPVRSSSLHGLLVVDKPGQPVAAPALAAEIPPTPATATPTASGEPYLLTSHDVVARVRRWSGQRRIGHTGTLDPMASGVIVLCLGLATRLVKYSQSESKQFYAEISLGAATDTYDAVGAVTQSAPVPPLTHATIDQTLARFRGVVEQRAPVFSALKQDGKSLHQRVRRGEAVVAPLRPVTFYSIDLLAFAPPDRIALRVTCSAGAYIRSLAYDLGLALDTVGHLALLRREQVGSFALAAAHDLPSIERIAGAGALSDLLLPLGANLPFPALTVDSATIQQFGHGQVVELAESATIAAISLLQVYDAAGQLAGIARRLDGTTTADTARWKAEKWLANALESYADLR